MVGFRAVVYIHMHQEDAMPTVEPLDSREEKVVTAVREARDEIIALASELISYDTTARNSSEPTREEVALQTSLARRLEAAGASIDMWEPEPTAPDSRFLPPCLLYTSPSPRDRTR